MGIIFTNSLPLQFVWPDGFPAQVRMKAQGGGVTIFDVPVSPATVGSTSTLDSGPIFQQAVDFLTNGQYGVVVFDLSGGGQRAAAPPFFPPQLPKDYLSGGFFKDLRGCTIEGLDLRTDGFNTFQDHHGYNVLVPFTFVIRGKLPWWWRVWWRVPSWWRVIFRPPPPPPSPGPGRQTLARPLALAAKPWPAPWPWHPKLIRLGDHVFDIAQLAESL